MQIWGGNLIDRKSNTGFVFKLCVESVSWESTNQNTVALSSTEAECMALTQAFKQTIYKKNDIVN